MRCTTVAPFLPLFNAFQQPGVSPEILISVEISVRKLAVLLLANFPVLWLRFSPVSLGAARAHGPRRSESFPSALGDDLSDRIRSAAGLTNSYVLVAGRLDINLSKRLSKKRNGRQE